MSNLISLMLVVTFGGLAKSNSAERTAAFVPSEFRAHVRHLFTARDGLRLNYVLVEATPTETMPIVIAPGSGESAYRYGALVGTLSTRGYGPIYILEHRGQGFSDGTGTRPDLVHVDRFDEYVTDFVDFLRGPVTQDLSRRGVSAPPDIIAHSMGGAIVNLALGADPTLARKVVYIAPMMDINTSVLNPLEDRVALWATKLLCAAGLCDSIAVARLGRKRRNAIPGVAQEMRDGIFRGGVTPGWLKESIRATRRIRAEAESHAEPTLLITALRDRLIQNSSLRRYARTAKNCELKELDGRHGLHHEERLRAELGVAIDDFLRACERRLDH